MRERGWDGQQVKRIVVGSEAVVRLTFEAWQSKRKT
jgi:hypothetical protein